MGILRLRRRAHGWAASAPVGSEDVGKDIPGIGCSSCGHRSAHSQIWQSFKWTHPGELSVQDGINNCTLQLLHSLGIINMNSCSSAPGCDADGVN